MNPADILKRVDHTQLKPFATWDDIVTLCREARRYKTASVCVPPTYVTRIREEFGDDPVICTVVGFPLGYSSTAAKLEETRRAIRDGAREVDMVINISDAKNGRFGEIHDEIKALKDELGGRILKVIIETCYLDEAEKIRLCGIVTETGADFIKTSTGFGPAGATLEDVALFKAHIGPKVGIKAAGGIKTVADLEKFIEAGCGRLGTSGAVALLKGGQAMGY
ncbi:MAG: deoxyribose-phosphate aldolase [Planctomycetota bacterium]|jgi:deoxyribose-phosphate aldolase|nr:deoxyribose-phosphate aldolase [Planctomycetota bacterium]